MSYFAIDESIEKWCRENGVQLNKEFAGQDRRYIYKSSPFGDTFQIYIEDPMQGSVHLHAVSVETVDDVDFDKEWVVPIEDIYTGLDLALRQIMAWMGRNGDV